MSQELCEGYKHKIIYRIVQKHSDKDLTKYLFVGAGLEKKVQKILDKLAKVSYKGLENNERELLDKHIPNYTKKFGEIPAGKTRFVYDYIEGDDNINQLRQKITKYMSKDGKIILPHEQHLWVRTKSHTFDSYIRFINTVFRNDENIDKYHLYYHLKILLGVKTDDEVNQLVKKYTDKETASVSTKSTFDYRKIINDEEINAIFQQRQTILGYLYLRSSRSYQYEQMIVVDPFNNSIKDNEDVIRTEESDLNSYTLGSYGALHDNEIYLVTYSDFFKNYISEDADTKVHKYWDLKSSNISHNKRKSEYDHCIASTDGLLEVGQKLSMIYNKYEQGKKYKITKCKLSDFLVFEINSMQMRNFLDLEQLFYSFELDANHFPFVRYVIREDYSRFKINKEFIEKNRSTLIYKWRIIRSRDLPQKSGFLIFKVMIGDKEEDKEKHFTVCLFANGYMIAETQINEPETIKNMQEYLGIFQKFIERRLDKYTSSKYFTKPETSLIFNPQRAHKTNLRSKLKLFNFRMVYHIQTNNHNINKLYNIAHYYEPYFYCYPKANGLHLYYKKVNMFTSNESITNFIQKLFETEKKFTYQKKLQYKTLIASIFGLDQDDVMNRIDNVRLTENKTKAYFLYGTEITIYQDKDHYNVSINYLKSINQLMHLSYILELLFRQLSNYTELSSIYTQNQSYNTNLIAFEPTVTQKYITDEEIKYEEDANFFDLDLDLDLADFEDEKDQDQSVSDGITIDTSSKVTLDKSNIQRYANKAGKLKFTNYMSQMRELADPELYKFDDVMSGDQKNKKVQSFSYSRSCDTTQMRQPYILTKEEFDQIDDKESITGYMKYRNRYYICPRIWDYKAKKPISIKKFVEAGLKSPYTGGEALPPEKRNNYPLGDKYTVIIRKAGNYWENAEKEKKWPELLKKTGKDVFPGFTKSNLHPNKLCLPCCFGNSPADYDPKNPEMQQFKKPTGSNHRCYVDPDDEQAKRKVEDYDELTTRNENYIMSSNSILTNNRYGKLPDNIDTLLRNNQEIFIMSENSSLHEGSNCFLRKGVTNDTKSFLRSIASIKGIRYNQLIDLIVNNITPQLFVTLNSGNLIVRFRDVNTLPDNQKKFNYFTEFIKRHSIFCKQYDIEPDRNIITISDFRNNKIISDKKRRAYQRLYIIVSSLRNFLDYCRDASILYKRYTMFLDLFSRKLDWLFPKGANILIFYKDTGNMYCNPFIKHLNKPVIMLLMDNSKKFEPIFHVILRHKIKSRGIFELNHDIDLSYKQALGMKEKTSIIELIHNSQKRLYIFKQILQLHKDNCRDTPDSTIPIKFRLFEAIRVHDTLNDLLPEYHIVAQVVNIINKAVYLVTQNGTIVPIKPSATVAKIKIIFLEDILKSQTIALPQMIQNLQTLNEKTNGKLRVEPVALIKQKDHSKELIGIITEANGIIPVSAYPIRNNKSTIPIITKNIYLDIDYRVYDTQEYSDKRVSALDNITYLEMLYEQFKYEFSHLMATVKSRAAKADISRIYNSSILSIRDRYLQLYPIIFDLMFDISYLVNEPLEKLSEGLHSVLTKNIRPHYCSRLHKQKCIENKFCVYNKKAKKSNCKLQLTPMLLQKYTGNLVEEILRDPKTREMLFSDDYLPLFVKKQGRFEQEDDIYLTSEDYGRYKVVYSSSKYHDDNFDLYENKNPTKEQKIIKPQFFLEDGSTIRSGTLTTKQSSISKLKKGTQRLKNVYATVFDKDGKFRAQYRGGPCLFPYVYANNKQLVYECNKDKAEGQRCPTELDEHRRAVKWGFCPADPIKTRHKRKVKDVYASKDKQKGNDYKEGKCIFPFRYHPSYDLSWECVNTKHDSEEKWCATSLRVGQNMYKDLPIAADKTDDVYQKKWNWEKIYKDTDKYVFNNDFLRYKTRGVCDEGSKKHALEIEHPKLSLDDFDINKCEKTESKGGYSKKVLIAFARDVLGINMGQLTDKNGKKTKKKPELCKIIIDKYKTVRDAQQPSKDVNLLHIYTKDPKQCEKGDKGGGYYLTQLRKMAINYFSMDPEKAKNANKKELCGFIKPILNAEIKRQGATYYSSSTKSNVKLSKVYLKNPQYCEKGPKSGGYDIKELKHIAYKYFGIRPDITRKEELCKEIRYALEAEALANQSSTASTKWGKSISKTKKSPSEYYGYSGYDDSGNQYEKSRYSLPSISEKREQSIKNKQNMGVLRNMKKTTIRRLDTLPSLSGRASQLRHKNVSIGQIKKGLKGRLTVFSKSSKGLTSSKGSSKSNSKSNKSNKKLSGKSKRRKPSSDRHSKTKK
jgi:hypothetical protein